MTCSMKLLLTVTSLLLYSGEGSPMNPGFMLHGISASATVTMLRPKEPLIVTLRDGSTAEIPPSRYRWLGRRAVTVVLQYAGGDGYVALVRGRSMLVHGPLALVILTEISRVLRPPSRLRFLSGVVVIDWAARRGGRRQPSAAPPTPTPSGAVLPSPASPAPVSASPTVASPTVSSVTPPLTHLTPVPQSPSPTPPPEPTPPAVHTPAPAPSPAPTPTPTATPTPTPTSAPTTTVFPVGAGDLLSLINLLRNSTNTTVTTETGESRNVTRTVTITETRQERRPGAP